jgi:hypothetical protein
MAIRRRVPQSRSLLSSGRQEVNRPEKGVPPSPDKVCKVFKRWDLSLDFDRKVLILKGIDFQSIHSKGDRVIRGCTRIRVRRVLMRRVLRFPLTTAGGRRRAKGLCFIRFPGSNTRSLPTHTRRERFPLDASLFYELSFSNFPLLYSSRSGVLCAYPADAKQRARSPGRGDGSWRDQRQQAEFQGSGLPYGCHIFQKAKAAISKKTPTIIGRVTFVAFRPHFSLAASDGGESVSSMKTSTKHDLTARHRAGTRTTM